MCRVRLLVRLLVSSIVSPPLRVRFQIIRDLETMHGRYLPTFYVRALRIIWKRTRMTVLFLCLVAHIWFVAMVGVHLLGSGSARAWLCRQADGGRHSPRCAGPGHWSLLRYRPSYIFISLKPYMTDIYIYIDARMADYILHFHRSIARSAQFLAFLR